MIVIFTSGQSNFEDNVGTPNYAWSPNPNAKIWNGGREGVIGTAFVALDPNRMFVPAKMASDIADANPGEMVYLINVVRSGTAISHWLPSTSAPDVYQNILDNVGPALAAIGATKIEYSAWWQGEADVTNASYSANFESLITRLKGNSWFTPSKTLIFSIASSAVSGVSQHDAMNVTLQTLATSDPSRIFVPSYIFPASPNWNSASPGHMLGAGYEAVGALAVNLLYDRETGWIPYTPLVSHATGSLPSATKSGKFRLLSNKTVLFNATTGNIGGGSNYLKISAPFPPAAVWSALCGFDANSGAALSTMVHGGYNAVSMHVLSATGTYPSGSPVITGFYERR